MHGTQNQAAGQELFPIHQNMSANLFSKQETQACVSKCQLIQSLPNDLSHDLMSVMPCPVSAQQSQLAAIRAEISQTAGQLSGATGMAQQMTPASNGAVPLLNNSVSLRGLRLLRERFPKLPADSHKPPAQQAKSWPAALRAACTKSMLQNSVKRTECDKWKTVITCFYYRMPIHMCFPRKKLIKLLSPWIKYLE